MNFTHLLAFYEVARAGSVSAGAERLHVSQPAVTREIKDLEGRLGLLLFDRLPRGVVLTEAGALLMDYAEKIFALADAAEADLEEIAGLSSGHLRIGASGTVGVYLVPDMLASFNATFPKVGVELAVINTEQVESGLIARAFALGFVEGPYDESIFDAVAIGYDEIIAVAANGHPLLSKDILASDLADNVVIMREAGSGTRAVVEDAYANIGLKISPILSISNTEAIKRMLLAQRSIAYLSSLSVKDELSRGELSSVTIKDLCIRRPLHMLRLKGRSLSPGAMAFFELVKGVLNKGN